MPGQVDFYVRTGASLEALESFACRLVETVWQRGHEVLVLAASDVAARRLDDLLWTFREESFVPHRMIDVDGTAVEPVSEPVIVSMPGVWRSELDVLVNLTPSVPDEADRAVRIAEIVPAAGSGRDAGRERYREYRNRGFELRTHR